jgi:hypothetical protein
MKKMCPRASVGVPDIHAAAILAVVAVKNVSLPSAEAVAAALTDIAVNKPVNGTVGLPSESILFSQGG